MYDRFVSLIAIVAVIACPMWCCGDNCQGASCCALDECCHEETSPAACHHCGDADCCGGNSSQEHDEETPDRHPSKPSCQGVCGGAVIEEACEMRRPDDSFHLPLIGHDWSGVSVPTHFRNVGTEQPPCIGAKNHGRFVRILHMSFLC